MGSEAEGHRSSTRRVLPTRAALRCIWPRSAARSRAVDASRARLGGGAELVANRSGLGCRSGLGGGRRFSDYARLVRRRRTIRLYRLDPRLSQRQAAVEGALRGYKELTCVRSKCWRPAGCCHLLLLTPVGWAAIGRRGCFSRCRCGRRVRLLERRGAGPDHPVVLNLPETEYMKCLCWKRIIRPRNALAGMPAGIKRKTAPTRTATASGSALLFRASCRRSSAERPLPGRESQLQKCRAR